MIYLCIYLAVGLLALLQARIRRIFWMRDWSELVGAVVAVALFWPLLFVLEAIGALQRWREERQRQREWDDPTLVSGEPTDDEPTLPCAPPEPADWDNVVELRGRR